MDPVDEGFFIQLDGFENPQKDDLGIWLLQNMSFPIDKI